MAARLSEHDFGTKGATKRKMRQLQREAPVVFNQLLFRYWQKVYSHAVRFVGVDTGALRATIRIQKGKDTTGQYVVSRGHAVSEYYILAGGGGIINPKHKRIVDYAAAHHDGVPSRGIPGNPFLDKAIRATEKDLDDFFNKYGDWYLKTWAEDQPTVPGTWRISLPVSEYQAGLEGRR